MLETSTLGQHRSCWTLDAQEQVESSNVFAKINVTIIPALVKLDFSALA